MPMHIPIANSVTRLGYFFALWATIQSRWQQLSYTNHQHCQTIFVKVSKSFIFLVKSFLGNFLRHLANFIWSHWLFICRNQLQQNKQICGLPKTFLDDKPQYNPVACDTQIDCMDLPRRFRQHCHSGIPNSQVRPF